jgi:hypothetical protein
MRTLGDQAEEFVELAFLDHVGFMTMLTLNVDFSFDEDAFKEQFVTGGTAVLFTGDGHTYADLKKRA